MQKWCIIVACNIVVIDNQSGCTCEVGTDSGDSGIGTSLEEMIYVLSWEMAETVVVGALAQAMEAIFFKICVAGAKHMEYA